MAQPYTAFAVTVWLGFSLVSAPARAEDARQAMLTAPAVAAVLVLFANPIRRSAKRRQEQMGEVPQRLMTILSGIKDMTLERAEVESDGNLAYETGVLGLVSNDGARTAARDVVVWKRVGDKWLLHRDIWNPAE